MHNNQTPITPAEIEQIQLPTPTILRDRKGNLVIPDLRAHQRQLWLRERAERLGNFAGAALKAAARMRRLVRKQPQNGPTLSVEFDVVDRAGRRYAQLSNGQALLVRERSGRAALPSNPILRVLAEELAATPAPRPGRYRFQPLRRPAVRPLSPR